MSQANASKKAPTAKPEIVADTQLKEFRTPRTI